MLSLVSIEVDFGTRVLFSNVSFLLQGGDRVGLVGRNGAGKSTLLGVITGDRTATAGEIHKKTGVRIGLLSQDLTVDVGYTLRETAMQAFAEVLRIQDQIDKIQHDMERRTDYESSDYLNLVQKLTDAHDQFERRGGLTMHADIERVLVGLGFEAERLDEPLTAFSGGWQMRAELGKLLLSNPDVLLLDEPTNHLDIESVQWLEAFLRDYEGAIMLVSHDRTFLDNVTNRTIEITNEKVHDIAVSYSDYEEIRAERLELQKAAAVRQARERQRVQKFIDRFRYKSSLASRVQSRIKHLQKMDHIEVEDVDISSMHFRFPPAPRSGRVAAECKNVSKSYGDNNVLKGVDFVLERNEKVAFLGKNGEGKSTLSKIIVGSEQITGGELIIGYNVSVGYYAQQQADLLSGEQTVLDVIENAAPPAVRPRARTLLGAFLFSGDDVKKPVRVLSGGEKSRLALCKLLLQPTNLLVLDEPTNHLDMLSKEVLKQALMDYDGAMIIVSHDRDFLDGLTDKVIGFKHGKLHEYSGDVDDFVKAMALVNADGSHTSAPGLASTITTTAPSPVASAEPTAQELREELKAKNREKKRLERRVQDLERQVGVQEKTIKECEVLMEDPALFTDNVKAHKVTTRYETAKSLVVSLMSEWETIQEQLEEPEA